MHIKLFYMLNESVFHNKASFIILLHIIYELCSLKSKNTPDSVYFTLPVAYFLLKKSNAFILLIY